MEFGPLEAVDIRGFSFESFVTFIFEREMPREEYWYWQLDITFDAQTVCAYYLRLLREPEFLLDSYSKAQLEEGFWAVQTWMDCSVQRVIWDEELPFALREQCVRSMFDLFSLLFAMEPLDSAVYMWWDSFCYAWHSENRKRSRGGEDLLMQDVMFETLSRILWMGPQHCQKAALHGLGHLHHPLTESLISEFLAKNPGTSEEVRVYAAAASKFDVL
jgi:hypothetical protein